MIVMAFKVYAVVAFGAFLCALVIGDDPDLPRGHVFMEALTFAVFWPIVVPLAVFEWWDDR